MYIWYTLYLFNVIGLPPGGSSTVHIYTQTVHRTTQNLERVRAVPRLCELHPGICLTTEEKSRKNLSQGSRRMPAGTMKTIHDNDLVRPFKISVTNTPVTKCKNPEDLNHQHCGHIACGTENNSTLHCHRNPWHKSNGGFKLHTWQNDDRLTLSFTDWSTKN